MAIDREVGRARDQVHRRPNRWVGLAAAAAFVCGLGACGSQSAPVAPAAPSSDPAVDNPAAEVIDSGPDCLGDEVVASMTGMPQDTGNAAPAAGAIPQGFEPVEVVLCRISMTDMLQEPSPPDLIPRLENFGTGESIPDIPDRGDTDLLQRLTVEEVTLAGDLNPLLDALARKSDPPSSGACMAMLEIQPAIFLVDAAGRAVRPLWPVDGCGFLFEGARESLDLLAEGDSTVYEIDQCIGRCSTEEAD